MTIPRENEKNLYAACARLKGIFERLLFEFTSLPDEISLCTQSALYSMGSVLDHLLSAGINESNANASL